MFCVLRRDYGPHETPQTAQIARIRMVICTDSRSRPAETRPLHLRRGQPVRNGHYCTVAHVTQGAWVGWVEFTSPLSSHARLEQCVRQVSGTSAILECVFNSLSLSGVTARVGDVPVQVRARCGDQSTVHVVGTHVARARSDSVTMSAPCHSQVQKAKAKPQNSRFTSQPHGQSTRPFRYFHHIKSSKF